MSKQKLLLFYIILVFTLLLHSCEKKYIQRDNSSIVKTFIVEEDFSISIKNKSNKKISLHININDQFANSIDDLVLKVKNQEDEFENESNIRKAWRFVATKIDFYEPISYNQCYDIPLLIYNSLGYGICDDFSILLNSILIKMEYHSRIVMVNNHIVVEVMNEGSWEMYDAFFYVYFLNKEGKVASIDELSKDSTLILDPIEKIKYSNLTSAEKKIRYHRNYSEENMLRFYKSEPKTYTSYNFQNDMFNIDLPSFAQIDFPVESPNPIFKTSSNGKIQNETYVKYTLSKDWKGKFEIPFLISHIEGKGIVRINNKNIKLGDYIIQMSYKDSLPLSKIVEIIKAEADIVIYCLINENFFLDINTIETTLRKDDYTDISIQVNKNQDKFSKIFSNFYLEKKSLF